MHRAPMRAAALLAGVTIAGAGLSTTAAPALAATQRLSSPSGVRVLQVSGSSVKVGAGPLAGATGYRLLVATDARNLTAAHLHPSRTSTSRRRPRMTVSGLPYRSSAYYFRVQALQGHRHRLEATIHAVYLRPARPAGLALTAGSSAPALHWTVAAAATTGYVVEAATDPAMTAGRRRFTLRPLTTGFTPYGLVRGRTYWFRVFALNHGTRSAPTATVRTVARGQQSLRVMTYNVLEANTAGQVESGTRLPAWEQRRPGVVALIRSRMPDVVAVQEAAAWVGPIRGFGGTRQIDDLAAALGPDYALAGTEVPPTQHGYRRTADYLLYRPAAWRPSGAGGHWEVGDGHFAAYQVLASRTSAARVLVVSTHLAVGSGAANDAVRERETQALLRQAAELAGPARLPVIYAGDYNSDVNRNHAFDGPGRAMRAAAVNEAERLAQAEIHGTYNSANLYLRRPPAVDQSIDYVYAGPGVAVASREVVVRLVDGAFSGVIPSDHNPVLAATYVSY